MLQLLWDLPQGVEFVETPLPPAEQVRVELPQEENLFPFFAPIRALCIDLLQNRAGRFLKNSFTSECVCVTVYGVLSFFNQSKKELVSHGKGQ